MLDVLLSRALRGLPITDHADTIDAVWGMIVAQAKLDGAEPPKAWRYTTAKHAPLLTLALEV